MPLGDGARAAAAVAHHGRGVACRWTLPTIMEQPDRNARPSFAECTMACARASGRVGSLSADHARLCPTATRLRSSAHRLHGHSSGNATPPPKLPELDFDNFQFRNHHDDMFFGACRIRRRGLPRASPPRQPDSHARHRMAGSRQCTHAGHEEGLQVLRCCKDAEAEEGQCCARARRSAANTEHHDAAGRRGQRGASAPTEKSS